jgi:sulfate transport system ATP-binding protein
MRTPSLPAIGAERRSFPVDVKVRDVTKDYGRYPALKDVSLDIRSGELVALLGPSGSGKTTLLRTIAGLEIPNAGTILFGNEDASRKPVQERNVGFVFQHYALFRHMTVLENVAFGLRVRERSRRPSDAAIRKRVLELLSLVQLEGLESRYPAQLSGGQRQRVALARALAIEPQVLLLDEPFGALDAKVRKELRRWLREIHDETGHTTVFVTHDQEEALELADRVAVLHKGVLQQVGSPDEIYDAPATPFVYAFIGDSSSIDVDVRDGQVRLDKRTLPLQAVDVANGPAKLFVRPHDVTLNGADEMSLPGIVSSLRRQGPFRRADIEIGPRRSRIEALVPPERDMSVGEHVGLSFSRFAVFPADAFPGAQ